MIDNEFSQVNQDGEVRMAGRIVKMDVLELMIWLILAIPKMIAMQMERSVMEFKMLAVSVRRGFARYLVRKTKYKPFE